jgi:MazG family protein
MRKMDERPIDRLLAIMARLRAPDGCPWDREQTFESIAPYTVEEAYEVADAIAHGDLAALKDELGDLFLQVVFHARIAEEAGAFGFDDVATAISDKMVDRHPHVFGDALGASAAAQTVAWEERKARERAARAGPGPSSALDGVAVGLPGLTRAVKLQNRAAGVGFDWPDIAPVYDKIAEELAELHAAEGHAEVEQEYGDLLFAMANLARHLKLDPEAALRAANRKFERRFKRVEDKLRALDKLPGQSTLAEMDRLWDEAKAEER